MKKQKKFISHTSSVFSGMACGTISKTPVNLSFPFLKLLSQKRSQARRMSETPRLGGRVNHPHQRFYGRQCRFCCQIQSLHLTLSNSWESWEMIFTVMCEKSQSKISELHKTSTLCHALHIQAKIFREAWENQPKYYSIALSDLWSTLADTSSTSVQRQRVLPKPNLKPSENIPKFWSS